MLRPLYAYKDNSIGFGDPFTQANEHVAVRNFMDMAEKTGRNVLNDIDLYQIGTYNDETGKIELEQKLILKGSSVIKEGEKNYDVRED